MRAVRLSIGKLAAAILLTFCVGVQALEASGRWDRTFQDAGDEAAIITVVLCVGAAVAIARAIRHGASLAALTFAILVVRGSLPLCQRSTAGPIFFPSPPLSLRV